ncbi:MAG: hypothetical protein QOF32_2001, partial [Gammaproteobacteria bacterium]|nr:hypothetical protein [Gammaproteobacteria bacterium]
MPKFMLDPKVLEHCERTSSVTNNSDPRGLLATGGGDATASGVNFQQSIGAMVCSWLLVEHQIDRKLNLGATKPVSVRFETEAPLDDILIATSDGGFVAMQAKVSLSSSQKLDSEYGKTLDQIARQWLACRDGAGRLDWDRPLDETRDRLVIVVGPRTPATVRQHLSAGLDARRQIGCPNLNANEQSALADFDACLGAAWLRLTGQPSSADFTLAVSRLTFVYVFDPAGIDSLAMRLVPALVDPSDSVATWQLLERVSGDLMSVRGGVNVEGLRRDLFGRGAKLAGRADYRRDIETLRSYTDQTVASLSAFEKIEADSNQSISIRRDCQGAVLAAARAGSLLLIGEPGAGKSGVVNVLARDLRDAGSDVVVLAVDRFSVQSLEGLKSDLNLDNGLVQALNAWDGNSPGYLIIDALDASRGGSGEAVFRTLIQQMLTSGSRWTIVASIRTFDLNMGESLRTLFQGPPPNPDFGDRRFHNVVHVRIPEWSEGELDQLKALSPKLGAVLDSGTEKLRKLAAIPFNTRLVADLILGGIQDFAGVDSQIALMSLYWERRVERHGRPGEVCLRAVLDCMVEKRALRAPLLDVASRDPTALQALEGDGALIAIDNGRSIQFRHHLLFDFAASRLLLNPDTIISGTTSFQRADALGLMLAPALTFLLRELWAEDGDRVRFWIACCRLLGDNNCDPIIRSVTSRMAAELPLTSQDTQRFAEHCVAADQFAIGALTHVVGAVSVRLEDDNRAPLAPWVHLARELSSRPDLVAWPLRLLGFLLIERVTDDELRTDLGVAMRALLSYGFTLDDSRLYVVSTLGFVADTFSTAPGPSRVLLETVLSDSRFDRFASDEIPALARKIKTLADADPDFAAKFYGLVYTRGIEVDRQTSIGGQSRILTLSSNARQDYDHSRYMLGEYFQEFLEGHPVQATRALIDAMEGYVARVHPIPKYHEVRIIAGPDGEVSLMEDFSHIWAREAIPTYGQDGEVLLARFLAFLKAGSVAAVIEAIHVALRSNRLAAIWSRLFMVGAAREDVGAILWPYACQEPFILAPDTQKDAIDLIAARYARLPEETRRTFEAAAPNFEFSIYNRPEDAKRSILRRLFGAIGVDQLLTAAARTYVDQSIAPEDVNLPVYRLQVESSVVPPFAWLDEDQRIEPSNARLTSAIEATKASLHLELGNDAKLPSLSVAIAALQALKEAIDGTVGGDADETLRAHADGILSQGCGKVIGQKLVAADTDPALITVLVSLIEFCAASSAPSVGDATEDEFERTPSWASPASRVDAAANCL